MPGGDVVAIEARERGVSAGAGKDFHQIDRALEEPGEPLRAGVDVETLAQLRILSGDSGGAEVGVADPRRSLRLDRPE